ncbi:Rolly protein [Operophtera brumata]|uniref:Rolly protein n=1 Tax=Operophtera brumata TaxID=104452 RepID=A0A0L7LBQ9_OPEBR|nr:Rolly protein [Operophtera brumata]
MTAMSKSKRETYEKLLEIEMNLDKFLDDKGKHLQVQLLHQYNDVKDATQVVIEHIANLEGTSVTEIHRRLNLEP